MEQISTFINFLEQAGIKYEVDQSADEDGGRTLDVYVYDNSDSFAVFSFDAYDEPDLKDFRIYRK
jgi:hypothetical protein